MAPKIPRVPSDIFKKARELAGASAAEQERLLKGLNKSLDGYEARLDKAEQRIGADFERQWGRFKRQSDKLDQVESMMADHLDADVDQDEVDRLMQQMQAELAAKLDFPKVPTHIPRLSDVKTSTSSGLQPSNMPQVGLPLSEDEEIEAELDRLLAEQGEDFSLDDTLALEESELDMLSGAGVETSYDYQQQLEDAQRLHHEELNKAHRLLEEVDAMLALMEDVESEANITISPDEEAALEAELQQLIETDEQALADMHKPLEPNELTLKGTASAMVANTLALRQVGATKEQPSSTQPIVQPDATQHQQREQKTVEPIHPEVKTDAKQLSKAKPTDAGNWFIKACKSIAKKVAGLFSSLFNSIKSSDKLDNDQKLAIGAKATNTMQRVSKAATEVADINFTKLLKAREGLVNSINTNTNVLDNLKARKQQKTQAFEKLKSDLKAPNLSESQQKHMLKLMHLQKKDLSGLDAKINNLEKITQVLSKQVKQVERDLKSEYPTRFEAVKSQLEQPRSGKSLK